MAEAGSWENIKRLGLLSTTALLDHCKITGAGREKYELSWRPKLMNIPCGELGEIVIRDQIPMDPSELEKCLKNGTTTQDWYKLINGKVFFWAEFEDLKKLLSAKQYKNEPHLVITVKTEALLKCYIKKVRLSQINSGSVYYDHKKFNSALPRDYDTFKEVKEYNWNKIKEVTVEYGIPDILDVAISAVRWIAHKQNYDSPSFEVLDRLWPLH